MNEELPSRSTINPYRLAELVSDRPIDWNRVTNRDEVFQTTLGMTTRQLLTPDSGSPVFAGLRRTEDNDLVAVGRTTILHNLRLGPGGLPIDDDDLDRAVVPNVSQAWLRSLQPSKRRKMLSLLLPDLESESSQWDPDDYTWKDVGSFVTDNTEGSDPDQGAVGDCWLIAALASVAMTHPSKLIHPTGSGPHTINLHGDFSGWKSYTGSEKIPVNSSNRVVFAKSLDSGEIWPALYEKAYAQRVANTTSDTPNILKLTGGFGTDALRALTGFKTKVRFTKGSSANKLYEVVDGYSAGGKAVWPMVASTYSGDFWVPGKYADVNIVANHVYSVLGHLTKNGEKYIVLRNPWGKHSATVDVASGTWNGQTLGSKGLFALKADTFDNYFAALGVAIS